MIKKIHLLLLNKFLSLNLEIIEKTEKKEFFIISYRIILYYIFIVNFFKFYYMLYSFLYYQKNIIKFEDQKTEIRFFHFIFTRLESFMILSGILLMIFGFSLFNYICLNILYILLSLSYNLVDFKRDVKEIKTLKSLLWFMLEFDVFTTLFYLDLISGSIYGKTYGQSVEVIGNKVKYKLGSEN